jgi:hypothetical protein
MKNARLFIDPLTMDFGESQNNTWAHDIRPSSSEDLPIIGRLSPGQLCVRGFGMGSTRRLAHKYREIAPRRTARLCVLSNPTRSRGTFHVLVFMVLR